MGLKDLVAKIKAWLAEAEKAGAEVDPSDLAEGKELMADEDLDDKKKFDGAKDDETDDLSAQLFALIDQVDDRELADKIKAKIAEAQTAPAGDDDLENGDDPGKDNLDPDKVDIILAGLEAMLKGGTANDVEGGLAGKDKIDAQDVDDLDKDKGKGMASDKAMRKLLRLAQDMKTVKIQAANVKADAQRHFRSLYEAVRKVAPLIGELDPMAFDSAGDIYRHTLKAVGVKVATKDTAALSDMVTMALDSATDRKLAMRTVGKAVPCAFEGAFAHLKNIEIQTQ